MDSEESRIRELRNKLKLPWRIAFVSSLISAFVYFPSIVYYLQCLNPEWGQHGFVELIKQVFSSNDFFIASLKLIITYIILFVIWQFFTRYRIFSKIIVLQEEAINNLHSKNKEPEDSSSSQSGTCQ